MPKKFTILLQKIIDFLLIRTEFCPNRTESTTTGFWPIQSEFCSIRSELSDNLAGNRVLKFSLYRNYTNQISLKF
jgi:hypothetical protein